MLYQRFARPVTGKPAIPSRPLLDHIKTLCEDGNLQQTRELLTNDIHRLTKDDLVTLCQCSISKYETARRCVNIPCDTLLYYELATLACECNQVDIFEYLWETYSAPRCWGVSGRWTLSAAVNASSRLYESLLAKDPEIIGDIEERGPTSISAALDCGELEFIDCMLSKGVDINLGFPTGNPLETAALADTDESMSRYVTTMYLLTCMDQRLCNRHASASSAAPPFEDPEHFGMQPPRADWNSYVTSTPTKLT